MGGAVSGEKGRRAAGGVGGAKEGEYAVTSFAGTRDDGPFEGGTSERMPLILGQEHLIPGFETNLLDLKVGDKVSPRHSRG